MAVSINVAMQTGYRVAITVAGMTSPYPWVLERYGPDGLVPVRGPGWVGDTVVIDNEAPLNTVGGIYYRLTWYDLVGSVLQSSSIDGGSPAYLEADLPVLGDPITGEYVELTIQQWPEVQRAERAYTMEVPGALYPITISDLMGSATSQITLRTDDVVSRAKAKALLYTGRTVLLRPACSGVDDETGYLHIRNLVIRRRSNNAGDPVRFWVLDVTHKTMPTPTIAATGATLEDLADAYPSPPNDLADLELAFPGTLLDIAEADL